MRACSLENEIQNLRKRIGEKVFLHKKELLSRESLSKYTTKGIIPFLKFLKNKQYKI